MAASKDKLAGVYVAEQMHEKMPNILTTSKRSDEYVC